MVRDTHLLPFVSSELIEIHRRLEVSTPLSLDVVSKIVRSDVYVCTAISTPSDFGYVLRRKPYVVPQTKDTQEIVVSKLWSKDHSRLRVSFNETTVNFQR